MKTNTQTSRGAARPAALVLAATLVGSVLACGGATPDVNYYATAISRQEQCCDGLADTAARDECRAQIRRLDSEAAANTDVNQQTYHCVERYFECDSATGRATRESAQAQLDCLNDLGSN
ncbi:MAG: hypothetical protein JXB32_02360 [Deltaproteobacteria bacterium]|nr:hypothetical protein [Deltaproteobacteria bacterium]